jgi:Na+-transporting NADH:ubiquinone oxidoreductase subunit A
MVLAAANADFSTDFATLTSEKIYPPGIFFNFFPYFCTLKAKHRKSVGIYMTKAIKLKQGLDIPLAGRAQEETKAAVSSPYCTVFPDDYAGLTPKVAVKQNDRVLAGTPLLFDKNHPEIKIVSPVSGTVAAVNRGEKRKLESIVIQADDDIDYLRFHIQPLPSLTPETLKSTLAEAGILAFFRQRPYDVTVNPNDMPRDIFVPGFYSAPLAPNIEYILKGQENDFQTGLDALAKLTAGNVYLSIRSTCRSEALKRAANVRIVTFEGPHPAGNVGVQINHIRPVDKGDVVWTINPQDVLLIGRFLNRGVVDMTRLVALTGPEVAASARAFYPMLPGAGIESLTKGNVTEGRELRYISGHVLTGTQIAANGSLHAFDNQITVIPEGKDTDEFLGWILPGFRKYSVSRTYPAFLLRLFSQKTYRMDARIGGGRRSMIMANEWDKVFPMDILPEFLVRAVLAQDIDRMERLGIYEVAPEDFALCEFVDTSKMELQQTIRAGLDWLHKEMS